VNQLYVVASLCHSPLRLTGILAGFSLGMIVVDLLEFESLSASCLTLCRGCKTLGSKTTDPKPKSDMIDASSAPPAAIPEN